MGEQQGVDYAAVLADLKAKRERLDAAIAGIEAMLGIRGLASAEGGEATPPSRGAHTTALGPGAFLGMSIAEATRKLLAAKRQNMRTEEITRALQEGGLVLSSANAANTVGSVLNRTFSSGGDIVRVSRGVWGLASWHPRLRKRNGEERATGGTPGASSEAQVGEEPSSDGPDAESLA